MSHTHVRRALVALVLFSLAPHVWASPDLRTRAIDARTAAECRELLREVGSASDPRSRTIRGILYHNLFRSGDRAALDRAEAELDGLDDPMALAYLGSVKTLQGGVAVENGKPIRAARMVRQGFKLIDLAVDRDPDSVALRLLRVENGISVGRRSPFKRYDVIERDIAYLTAHPDLQRPDDRARMLYLSASARLDAGEHREAADLFARAHQAAPESRWGREARAALRELEE